MAYLAVNKNGDEVIYEDYPVKNLSKDCWEGRVMYVDDQGFPIRNSVDIDLPKGSIKKLIGKDLTFDDEPISI